MTSIPEIRRLWARKRSLVLERANHTCEGCGIRRATQVHHLTYKHVYDEFLWELVATCDECHDRAHEQVPGELSCY